MFDYCKALSQIRGLNVEIEWHEHILDVILEEKLVIPDGLDAIPLDSKVLVLFVARP